MKFCFATYLFFKPFRLSIHLHSEHSQSSAPRTPDASLVFVYIFLWFSSAYSFGFRLSKVPHPYFFGFHLCPRFLIHTSLVSVSHSFRFQSASVVSVSRSGFFA
uniref:Uncharacterized protein n=1 Tax=Cacopsylla melanoneura TaxID=428564 RepID=A0A8D9BPM3_9HEMI